jgi:hypothetical protein
VLLITLGLVARPGVDFAQWDNLEVVLPMILLAHRRILHGELPLWNPYQNLGEPLHAMGIGGVLYPPYTACTWFVDAFHLDPRALASVIVALHAGFAGLGLFCLCRSFGVRASFALVAAVSGALSGFALMVSSVWLFVMPTLAWSAWALWAAKELVDGRRPARAAIVGAVSLAMPFAVGHAQLAVDLWLVTAAFALGLALLRRNLVARARWLLATGAAAALMAAPCVLPTLALLPDTERAIARSAEQFGKRGVDPRALIGLVLPVYGGGDGFLETASTAGLHAGSWLLPALLATGGAMVLRRRRDRRKPSDDDARRREWTLNVVLAGIVILLSLGNHTPVYGWTHAIPIWSSFRWPFKLFLAAVPLLLAAGAMALETLARDPIAGARRWFLAALPMVALVSWWALPGLRTPAFVVTGVLALLAMLALVALDTGRGRAAFVTVAILEAGSMVLLALDPRRNMVYAGEKIGSFDARRLGISTDYRLLPLSPAPGTQVMQELSLFDAATLNRYYSLTGARGALQSSEVLPTSAEGLLPAQLVPVFLQSGLMRSYNGRYVLVARGDTATLRMLGRSNGYRPVSETPGALVFANADALPRLYFATEVQPLEGMRDFVAGLIENQAPSTRAYVEGGWRTSRALPPARVERSEWGYERVAADVAAPQGGFLVISMRHSPDWKATVDGRPATLWITNAAISGVEVPAGAKHVVVTYRPASLRWGFVLALLGLAVLSATVVFARRRSRREP